MSRRLLDTDIFSEIRRGRNPMVVRRAADYLQAHECLSVTIFTVAEVVSGWQSRGREDRIESFLNELDDTVEVLDFIREAAVLSGRIFGSLRASGTPIGRIDPFIAAIAMYHGFTLVTGNLSHYQRIIDLGYPLSIEDWRKP